MLKNKYLYLIPLALVEVVLQLAFFWLAPDVPCYWAVYAFVTTLSLIHIALVFGVGIRFGVRRGSATVVVGSFCMAIVITTAVVLLFGGASVRNAIFALAIETLVYAIFVAALILSIERDDQISGRDGYAPDRKFKKPQFCTDDIPDGYRRERDFSGNAYGADNTPRDSYYRERDNYGGYKGRVRTVLEGNYRNERAVPLGYYGNERTVPERGAYGNERFVPERGGYVSRDVPERSVRREGTVPMPAPVRQSEPVYPRASGDYGNGGMDVPPPLPTKR